MGVRKKEDLEQDLLNLSITKIIFLFILVNLMFIGIIILITKFIL